MTSLTGREIGGRYRLDALLGDGGMGTVYRAYDLNLDRIVALKLMHAHFARKPEFRARLTQEARAIAQLDHPSIVRVYDFGDSDEGLYIAMEYLGSGSLRLFLQRLQEQNRYLPLDQSLQIGAQIADALGYAHQLGVIHRDVKPGNIILKRITDPGNGEPPFRAVLTDFGLVMLHNGHRMTQSGATVGTPLYMSPEQCKGRNLDGRSDLYSLGVVLYELITNRPPFEFNSLSDAVMTHINKELPPPARQFRPDVPPLLETLLSRALAKSPTERFATGGEMAAALRSAIFALSDTPTQVLSLADLDDVAAQPSEEPPSGYQLIIATPGLEPSLVVLNRRLVTLGRSADNDIVLPAEGVSRHHARLEVVDGQWSVMDLGGINGTFLNGTRLRANQLTPFAPGSRLKIGPYEVLLEGPDGPELPVGQLIDEALTEVLDGGRGNGEPRRGAEPLALFLTQEKVTVDPGRQAELHVEVVNRSPVNDRVNLRVHGIPAEWVTLPDAFVPVEAHGGSVRLTLVLHPPRDASTPSGRQRLRVEVVSQQHPGEEPAANAFIVIGGFVQFDASMTPAQLRVPGMVTVALENRGNAPAEFSVVGRDLQGGIRFHGETGRLRLEPGQTASVDLQLEPRQQMLFGTPESFAFEVEITPRGGKQQTLRGTAQVGAMLPVGVLYGLLFLLVFACTLAALFVGLGRSRIAGPAPTAATGTPLLGLAATQTAVAAVDTITAATQTAVAVGQLGDRDEDGLSDAQEAQFGSDPNNPDTDGDGLLDGEELLVYGTDARRRDSDGDLLSDYDEVHTYGSSPIRADTDGDGIPDGVEVQLGTDPLAAPAPTAEASATSSPTAALLPTNTPTMGPTATPSLTPESTPTATATALPTATPIDTPTTAPSATSTATAVPTVTPTPSVTALPNPMLTCVTTAPDVNAPFDADDWGGNPLFQFQPEGASNQLVQAYLVKNNSRLYLAFVINDPTIEATDSLRVYFDTTDNDGDPDSSDRFFQVGRDRTMAIRAGVGTNSDGLDWDPDYSSSNWKAVVEGETTATWIVKMDIDTGAEMGAVTDPFGLMAQVLYTGILAEWPMDALIADASTWQGIDNQSCP